MSTSLLDLFGVVLIGLVSVIAISAAMGEALPSRLNEALRATNLDRFPLVNLAIYLAFAAGLVLILKSVTNLLLSRRILRFLANRQAAVAGRLTAELLSRPLLMIQRKTSQETAFALTGGVGFATLFILSQAVSALTEISLLIVLTAALALINLTVTLFTIAFFAVVALVLHRILSSWAGKLGARTSKIEIESLTAIQAALKLYRESLVSGRRQNFVASIQELRWQSALTQSDAQFLIQIPKYVFEIALILGASALALSQIYSGQLVEAVTMIAVFLAAGSRIVPCMLRLQTSIITLRNSAGQAQPTFELASELSRAGSSSNGYIGIERLVQSRTDEAIIFVPSVSVNDVSVTYPGRATPAVSKLNFKLNPGESLAITGPTGAGKSTLVDLVLGVTAPDSGHISISDFSPEEAISLWPGRVAYVPQEIFILNRSVRENVAPGLALDEIDDQQVWRALERAHVANFVRSELDGLDALLGEDGSLLSGGQRQRIGIARALYSEPGLLVMDEATSALDTETESAITETVRELSGQVTTIVVAHRLSTVRNSNIVLFLEGGIVAASGTFDEVREMSPRFNSLAELAGL